MKKQGLTILLILLISMISTKAMAYDIAVKNEDGVTIYYNYINDGKELEVAKGSYSGNVVIPDEVTYMNRTRKVTSIGDHVFDSCSDLTSVTIPKSMTSIGNYAFKWSSVKSVTIGNSVTSIGEYAFTECYDLTSVILGNSVTSIGDYAFSWCYSLNSVTIGNSVTSIGDGAFSGCNIPIIVSLIENPFRINEYVFTKDTYNNATLYVPIGTTDKYKATDGWKNFVFIEEGDIAGVNVVENTKNNKTTIYDLNGVRQSEPKKGINIINGKKVVVK